MKIVDMHCDTLMIAFLKHGLESDMYRIPNAMVDLERLQKGNVLAQFFAIFMVPQNNFEKYYNMPPLTEKEYIMGCHRVFENNIKKHSDIVGQAKSVEDIIANEKAGKISAVLTMEDGVAVHGEMERLKWFYDLGVRALSLTWNYKNCFGSPNSDNPNVMNEGLTDFGKEAVEYMQEIGMLVDVSHLSDGGFYDVSKICKKPFVATHSNCRSICSHRRNMTDDMIRILAEKGGVAGINFAPEFLSDNQIDSKSTIEQIINMIKHMKNIGGIDVVAIGSDFDGISGDLEISSSEDYPILIQALEKEHFTTDEIERITHKNVIRVMKDCM
jgi:membrane dipeptidase